MDAQLISYGEQFGMLNNRISNLDDHLIKMETNQKRYIQNFCATYLVPLRGYHFASDMDGSPQHD